MSYWHKILGIDDNSTREEILKAYRKKALEFHPDVNKSPDASSKFKEVNNAFRALMNSSYEPKPKPKPKSDRSNTFKDSMSGQYYGENNRQSEFFVDSMAGTYEPDYKNVPKPIRTWNSKEKLEEINLWRDEKNPVDLFWNEYHRLKRVMAYEDSAEFWKKLDEYMEKIKKSQ